MTRKIPLRFDDYLTGDDTGDNWAINIKPCVRTPKSFHQELLNNAEIIRSLTSEPIHVMFSGGIDSEYVLNIFQELKIPVTPVIVKLSEYNSYDLDFATRYCTDRSLSPIIIDIDFDHFVKSGKFLEIAQDTETPVFQYPSMFYAITKLDGVILIGSDEPHFVKIDDRWEYNEMERLHSLSRTYEKYNIEGTPSLLNWSSETLLSFMNEPEIELLFNNHYPGRLGSNFLKNTLWSKKTPIQIRDKKDGFEIIRQSPIFQHPDVQSVVTNPYDSTARKNGIWTLEQSKLRNLLQEKI